MLANPTDPPVARDAGDGKAASPRAAAAIRRMRREGTKDLACPLTISGVSPQLGKAIEATGSKYGRPIIAVPAGPLGSFPVQELQPGAAVSVGYSGGDLRLGAIGTVAYTDAGRVWSFGHSFEAAGARNLLLQDAYVYRVVNEPNAALHRRLVQARGRRARRRHALQRRVLGRRRHGRRAAADARRCGRSAPTTTPASRSTVETNVADETDVDNPTGFSPLGAVGPLAIAQAAGGTMKSAPGRLTGRMCLRITFAERPNRPARFCNRYVSSGIFDPFLGPLGNPIAFSAAMDASSAFSLIEFYEGRTPHVSNVHAEIEIAPRRAGRVPAPGPGAAAREARPGGHAAGDHAAPARRQLHQALPRQASRAALKPGRRTLRLRGFEQESSEEDILAILFGLDPEAGGGSENGPARLNDLIESISALGHWDGVQLRMGGSTKRAFKDDDMLIVGSAETSVRVRRALALEPIDRARRRQIGAGGARHRRGQHGGERRRARGHHVEQRLHRRRLLGHAVGVVGRVAEQRVRQLGLAAQHRLRPAGLRHVRDAAGRQPADLGARVEARPVDVAVAAAVADRHARLARRPSSSTRRSGSENGPSKIQCPRRRSPGSE